MSVKRRFLMCAAVGVAGSSIVRAAELAVPFEAAGPDGLPAGFSVGLTGGGPAPVWVRHSGDGGSVLVQTSTDRTDYRFPLAIYDKATVADVAVSVRFLAESGSVDRAAGIAVRLKDANNYYVIRANALEDNVNFYRMTDGMRREIQGASVKVASGVWHVLGLRAQGDRFTASFDGTVLFAATDRTIAGVGKVALWTKADSVTRFAGLSIETL